MPGKAIDLQRVRQADERLQQLLEAHPELREDNPERQQALHAWLGESSQEDITQIPCFECGEPAEHSHHVVPRVYGGTRTVPLCAQCHGKVHGKKIVTSATTRQAMARKRAHGEKLGGDMPYGYGMDADGKTLVPHHAEQGLLGTIRTLRARGLTHRTIVAELAQLGFTTRKGTALRLFQVQRIMARDVVDERLVSPGPQRGETTMPRQPTGNPIGRPVTYTTDDERPVSVSLRIPADLYAQTRRYAARHVQTVTELLLDGLKMRLEQEDPRYPASAEISYDSNAVIQELAQPLYAVDADIPCDDDVTYSAPADAAQQKAATAAIPYDSNAVIQESAQPPVEDARVREIAQKLASGVYVLGKLCKAGHGWQDTRQSVLKAANKGCVECDRHAAQARRFRARGVRP